MKYVKTYLFLIIVLLLTACSDLKAPKYVGVENVNVSEIRNDSIIISAGLKFNNPNSLGGKVVLENLQAVVNDIDLGKIKNQEVEVSSKKDFSVPLEIKMSYNQLFDSKKGLLNSILGSLLSNEVEVKLDGKATFRKFLIQKEYPIHFKKKVKILK